MKALALVGFLTLGLTACISDPALRDDSPGTIEIVPPQRVRLLDGPFKDAQDRNLEYVMAMDPDRLLAPYLVEAGLMPRAENYGNWESSGLNGHMGGHYLSALSLAWAATGSSDVLDRLNYMLDELQRAQDANGNGYLGGVPGGDALWLQIASGDIRADLFALNDSWVPWYNLHKTFAGLRDAWLYADSRQARSMLEQLAHWAAELTSGLSDEQVQAMLRTEHGGMNEVFADVAAITGNDRFLRLAERFSDRTILRPLLEDQDQLDGLHANTQIPKVVGFERIAELGERPEWHRAATYFWDTVVNRRTVAFGGNSVREHFHSPDDFEPMIRNIEGPETCNTYNMLRLTHLLYQFAPEFKYINYYERALYNHILSSQDPATGGLVYFTPVRPQHYRVYSQVHESMWCCVGSGIENHFKYGEFIYAFGGDDLIVNLFIPSRVAWPEKGVVLSQENAFPDEAATSLIFESDTDIGLRIRYPTWAAADHATVLVNGEPQDVSARPGSYIQLQRAWKKGDIIRLELPMATHTERLPDGSDYFAILHGPIVLSAPTRPFADDALDFYADDSRMGHIASGAMCQLESSPMLVSASPDIAEHVQRVDDTELRFRLSGIVEPATYADTELIPFFRVHHTRYTMYWPYSTPEKLELRRRADALTEAARIELESLTIDELAPGEQQPEAEHAFSGTETEAGVNFNRHWRHASGWFGYTLADKAGEARYLRIDYWGADQGRSFVIEMNGVVVADVTLTGEHGPSFVSVDYPLRDAVIVAATDGRHHLKFIAADGSIAGGIYGIRLLSGIPELEGRSTGD